MNARCMQMQNVVSFPQGACLREGSFLRDRRVLLSLPEEGADLRQGMRKKEGWMVHQGCTDSTVRRGARTDRYSSAAQIVQAGAELGLDRGRGCLATPLGELRRPEATLYVEESPMVLRPFRAVSVSRRRSRAGLSFRSVEPCAVSVPKDARE